MRRYILVGLALWCVMAPSPARAAAFVGVNLIRPDWVCHGEAEYFDAQYIGKYTTAPDGNPWNKQFLSDMSIYHCIRFMDWLQTITVTNVSWATRTQKNGPDQKLIAYEWMCDLCNRLNADMWLNVPHMADSTYVTNLGQLIHSLLKPNLKVYLEYSNETWWEPNCNPYIVGVGDSLASNIAAVKNASPNLLGDCFLSARMWNWFRSAWSRAGGDVSLCVNVLGGQLNLGGMDARTMIGLLTYTTVNPSQQKCDAFAEAPYFDAANPLGPMASMNGALAQTKPKGVALICYEGGHNDASEAVSQYGYYMTYLDSLNTRLSGPFMQFGEVGTGCSVQWGAKSQTSESDSTAYIWRALRDWSLAHPPVAVSVRPAGASASSARSAQHGSLPIGSGWYGLDGRRLSVQQEKGRPAVLIAITPGSVLLRMTAGAP